MLFLQKGWYMLSEIMKSHKPVDASQMRAAEFLMRQKDIELDKINRVLKGSGFRSISSCPLCGSKESELELTKHSIDLLHCRNCDVRYNSKIPADLNDIYNDDSYVVHSKDDSDDHFKYRCIRFGSERVQILEDHCGVLTEKHILDIGCGTGFFMYEAAKKCKHVFGGEFSDIRRAEAIRRTGLTVFSQSLEKLPKRDFDIITAFDVLEHIREPCPFMRSIDAILKPGGFLLLYVPNFGSFSMRVMRQLSPAIDGTEHVILYNIKSLRFLFKMFDYEIVFTETQGMDIDNVLYMYQYMREPTNAFLLQWKEELQAMINEARCADSLRMMLRKP